jgi:predicted 3-demethylubiquinone-9 3-methyltransferase (glyoxalase superfamily)
MAIEQKITPSLWFDDQAEEAARFYTSLFRDSTMGEVALYPEEGTDVHGRPAGSVMIVEFHLKGFAFTALNGGPHFRINPTISFFVSCDTADEVDELWSALSDGGNPLMPLDSYPFSPKYGWIQDRYGVSWQLMLAEGGIRQAIMPSFLFVGDVGGRAEEAIDFYTSVFDDAETLAVHRYGPGREPDAEDAVMYADFTLEGQLFAAMDSAQDHDYTFNEGISLEVRCETQEEVDHYWERLSAHPGAEQCGWLKDRFGVSWQIVPRALSELMSSSDPERRGRVMEAMLRMKKLDIAGLRAAYAGDATTVDSAHSTISGGA